MSKFMGLDRGLSLQEPEKEATGLTILQKSHAQHPVAANMNVAERFGAM